MRENNFSGLCIGGPWDGQSRTHWSPQIVVKELDDTPPPRGYLHDPEATVPVSKTCYDFCPLTHMQAVWVHESMRQEGRGLSHVAIDAMAFAYATKKEQSDG